MSDVLSASTPWTRATRSAARTIVRNTPGFPAWRDAHNAGTLTKPMIVQAANDLGVAAKIAALVAAQGAIPGPAGAVQAEEDESGDEAEAIEAEAIEVEAPIPAADPVQAAIDSVLEPVRGYLAGGLLAEIEKRVRPIAVEANKPALPPVWVAGPMGTGMGVGAVPSAQVVRQSTMGKTFGVRGAQASLPVAIWDAQDAPRPDPFYVVEPGTVGQVATALEHGETVWLAGAMGTGKGALAKEYAARTGRGFVRIGFTRATEVVDLLGQSEPVPGETHGAKMVWTDKVFTQAIRRPGTVILLDELMISPPGTVAVFQTILDEKRVTLPTGEVVVFAPGVVVIIADNSAGYGDESGVYAGVQSANAALVDRCARLVIVDYLPPRLEALAVQHHTGAPFPACERLANFAAAVRTAAAKSGGEARPFSIRRMVAFVNATHRDLISVDGAWQITALSRLPEADRETFRQAIGAHFRAEDYSRELKGAAVPAATAPLSQDAAQVGARQAFPDAPRVS